MLFGGLFMSALALYLLLHAVKSLRQLRESAGWASAPGRITKAEFKEPVAGSKGWHSFMPEYDFEVDGRAYSGQRVALYTISDRAVVKDLRERYPVGAEVTVYYDPKNPAEAALINTPRPDGKQYSEIILGSLALALGLGLVVFSFIEG